MNGKSGVGIWSRLLPLCLMISTMTEDCFKIEKHSFFVIIQLKLLSFVYIYKLIHKKMYVYLWWNERNMKEKKTINIF